MDFYESQYDALARMHSKYGSANMGLMSSFTWNNDPKRLLFMLSRYKFVSKMFEGLHKVLEVGCGDGFASRLVAQAVQELHATDIDKKLLENAKEINQNSPYRIQFIWNDFFKTSLKCQYEGIYLLDVLEHIDKSQEDLFIENIKKCLLPNGQVIIGMPSLESQLYASKESKEGHINCKTSSELKKKLCYFFKNVNIFSMNDEVLHTGFAPMSHYLIALCN